MISGLFIAGDNGQLRFQELPAPTDDEVGELLDRQVCRIQRLSRRELDDQQFDWIDEEQQSLLNCTGEALRLHPQSHTL